MKIIRAVECRLYSRFGTENVTRVVYTTLNDIGEQNVDNL